jgi:hypothetical protein
MVAQGNSADNPIDVTTLIDGTPGADIILGLDCAETQDFLYYRYVGNLPLESREIKLRRAFFEVTGTITSNNDPIPPNTNGGVFVLCGGNEPTAVNTNTDETLSLPSFNYKTTFPLNRQYYIIDITGRIIENGITNENTHRNLTTSNSIRVIKVKGYDAVKIPAKI